VCYGVASTFSDNSNCSHIGIMVKDKHVKALDFMVTMKFSDSYNGFAAETKPCSCLAQFLGEEIMLKDARNFLISISSNLWNDIVQDDDDEEWTKGKSLTFGSHSMWSKCKRNLFYF